MRTATRLFAGVKPSRYLEAGSPTGLTGLFTHPAPRSHLLYLYGSTLERLKAFPESSVYRQSTEAITKHRMAIIDRIKPAGLEEWQKRAVETIQQHPDLFAPGNSRLQAVKVGDNFHVSVEEEYDREALEWDGEGGAAPKEGIKGERDANFNAAQIQNQARNREGPVAWEPEPGLEASQISEAETQIGAGLIEEVIEVAEGELSLVKIMAEHKVWDELEEKPPAGQWTYFSRDQHTPGTQDPPGK